MSYLIIKCKNKQDLLKAKAEGIYSGEVAAIVGIDPVETPYQLWLRKKGLLSSSKMDTRRETTLKEEISRAFQDKTGCRVSRSFEDTCLIVSKEYPHRRVCPYQTYRLYKNNEEFTTGMLECKITEKQVDAAGLPMHWFVEMQYLLGVSGLERGTVAWLNPDTGLEFQNVLFDPEMYAWLCEETDRFWLDKVLGNQEPSPANLQDILLKNPLLITGKKEQVKEACPEILKVKITCGFQMEIAALT